MAWLREALSSAPDDWQTLRVKRGRHVYSSGDREVGIYLLAEGQVKVIQSGRGGIDCITGLHTPGDIFGELSLQSSDARQESAVALSDVVAARIPVRSFTGRVAEAGMMEALVQYLAKRLAAHQLTIATLLTANAEQRLAHTLVALARKLGIQNDDGHAVAPSLRQEELAEMVGTTRSRIGFFLKRFRKEGLVDSLDHATVSIRGDALLAFVDRPVRELPDPGGADRRRRSSVEAGDRESGAARDSRDGSKVRSAAMQLQCHVTHPSLSPDDTDALARALRSMTATSRIESGMGSLSTDPAAWCASDDPIGVVSKRRPGRVRRHTGRGRP